MKFLIAMALLLSSSVSLAANISPLPGNIGTDETAGMENTVGGFSEMETPGNSKFAYAELIYQRAYGEGKFMVSGKTVTEAIKKAIPQVKYRDDALEIMGAEGWELSGTLIREFDGGFEIFYYFKKQIE